MATALLYNLQGKDKFPRMRAVLLRLGIKGQHVAPEEYGKAIGTLLGEDYPAPQEQSELFSEEMMVLYNLSPIQFNGLLQELRANRCPVALKAVVTKSNAAWSSAKLYAELTAEHEAIAKSRSNKAGKGSIHSK